MNARSAKNKGNRFENYLVEQFKAIDPKAHRTYGSGNGLDKNDIRLPKYDIEIEAKNQQSISLTEWWKQLDRQTLGENRGVLAIRNPKRPEFEETFVVLELSHFIELLRGDVVRNPESVGLDYDERTLSYKGQQVRQAIQAFLKEMESR